LPPKYNHGQPILIRYLSYPDCANILKGLSKKELALFLYARENKRIISKGLQSLEAHDNPLFLEIKNHWQNKNFSAGNDFFQEFTSLEAAHRFLSDWSLRETFGTFYRALDFVIDQSIKGAPVMHSLLIRTGINHCPSHKKFMDYQDYVLTEGNDLLKAIVDEGEFRPFDLICSKKGFDIVYLLSILKFGLKKTNAMMFSKVTKYSPSAIDVLHYFGDPHDLPVAHILEWMIKNKNIPRQEAWFTFLIERDETFLYEVKKILPALEISRSEFRRENIWLLEFHWKYRLALAQDLPKRISHEVQRRFSNLLSFFF